VGMVDISEPKCDKTKEEYNSLIPIFIAISTPIEIPAQ